jgi:hypothetical protein
VTAAERAEVMARIRVLVAGLGELVEEYTATVEALGGVHSPGGPPS